MKRIFFVIAAVMVLVSCGGGPRKQAAEKTATPQADVMEVIYFHGKQRCITCSAIERLTKAVVDSLGNEKVVMKIVDISKPENEAIADKYEVTWSSLVLDRGGKVENLTDMGFSYAKGQPEVFRAKLTEAIHNLAK